MDERKQEMLDQIDWIIQREEMEKEICHQMFEEVNEDKDLNSTIIRLVELAKAEYGEYEEEIIGYESGEYIGKEIFWSDEIVPLEKLQDSIDYGIPSNEDLVNRKLSNEQYFWYGERNEYCIAKRIKVLNKGWKIELLHIIKNI